MKNLKSLSFNSVTVAATMEILLLHYLNCQFNLGKLILQLVQDLFDLFTGLLQLFFQLDKVLIREGCAECQDSYIFNLNKTVKTFGYLISPSKPRV